MNLHVRHKTKKKKKNERKFSGFKARQSVFTFITKSKIPKR